jgi:hypothetical protein
MAAGMQLLGLPIHWAVLGVVVTAATVPALGQPAPANIGITEPSIATSLPQNGGEVCGLEGLDVLHQCLWNL